MRRDVVLCVFLLCLTPMVMASDIASTRHNLSVSGTGSVTSGSASEICVFCHTPHHSSQSAPLWNRELPSGQTYQLYGSSTLDASPENPQLRSGNASLLCLSCHDGTIALGDFINPSQEDPGFVPVFRHCPYREDSILSVRRVMTYMTTPCSLS